MSISSLLKLAAIVLMTVAACDKDPSAPDVPSLQVIDVTVGSGTTATNGKLLTVNYTGWLYDPNAQGNRGTKFDSSLDRTTPFQFVLGAGDVIAGWDQGVAGMKVGGKRILIIPSSLAYGPNGRGSIPGGAALVFEIDLLAVQ